MSRQVSWLTVCLSLDWRLLRLPAGSRAGACSGVAANITVHSCGGSRGIDRVPFLASANAEEPRKRKATHGAWAGQCPSVDCNPLWRGDLSPLGCEAAPCIPSGPRKQVLRRLRRRTGINPLATGNTPCPCPRVENPCQLTPNPRPCSPTRLVTGALHRVKRETGESCALLKAMSVRCCPRNGKRAKRQIHCASSSAWEGDACRFRLMPKPLASPETGPQHKVTITFTE